ncbi:MAG: penicillin-binding protein 2 [Patescibacteria group bacterium]
MDPFIIKDRDHGLKNTSLKGYAGTKWDGGGWTEETDINESISKNFQDTKISLFGLVALIFVSLVFVRVVFLQIFKGDYYLGLAEGNRIRVETVKASRGNIYDRHGNILAVNRPSFVLKVTPGDLFRDALKRQELNDRLLELFPDSDKEEINNLFDKSNFSYRSVILIRGIDYEKALSLKLKLASWPGISIEPEAKREYPMGPSASHLVGYLGKITQAEFRNNKNLYDINDLIGRTGVEDFYENILRGIDGQKEIEVDLLGKEKNLLSVRNPRVGQNLFLTIDADLQKKLFNYLSKIGRPCSAVIMNPNNGEILAIVSAPSYDNNIFIKGIKKADLNKLFNNPWQPLFFRAISGEYPSGSIVKPFIAAIALEEKVITGKTTVISTGGISIGSWFFGDWKQGGHGVTDVSKALAESVNTFFYYIGGGYNNFKGLGIEKLDYYLKLFGFGQKTGIDLNDEAPGLLPTPQWKIDNKKQEWFIGDTYHLSIGQGYFLVTPLQITNYLSAIVNGGILYKPQIIKKINNTDTGQDIIVAPQVLKKNIIANNYLDVVKTGMRQAVTNGSAKLLNDISPAVACKTGTAQVGENKNPHAWIGCFAPYNKPELVVVVLVENGGEGSLVAAPIARDILNWYFYNQNQN